MKQFLILISLSLLAMAQSQTNDTRSESSCIGQEISLDQFRWENRIIVLFAPDSGIDAYQTQMNKFSALEEQLLDRDLILISLFDNECSTLNGKTISDSSAKSIRDGLSHSDQTYSIFLIGKDGGVKLRRNGVLEPEELFRVIDRMPMRQREIREGK